MANGLTQISIEDCRNIALRSQGFGGARTLGNEPGTDDIGRVFDRLKVIQIDSVSALVRAQYMPFFSRLGPYDMDLLHQYTTDQRNTYEYWVHELCLVPMEHYPIFRYRHDDWIAEGRWTKFLEAHTEFERDIIAEIDRRGPLSASDLELKGPRIGYWAASPGKLALYHLHRSGRLAVSERRNPAPSYDLQERVVPQRFRDMPEMQPEERYRTMAAMAIDAMGVATATEISDYFRVRHREMSGTIAAMAESEEFVRLQLADSKLSLYAAQDWEHRAAPTDARCLLSPFDSLVWHRKRIKWLFDFRYHIEIYMPVAKREWGYYVQPFLLGNELVARVDLKCDRRAKTLRVPGAFLEDGADREHVAHELADELRLMAGWLGMERVVIGRRGNLVPALRSAVKSAASNA